MKHIKRIASLTLAVLMVFAMMTTAFAADEETPATGTITINGVGDGTTYSVYKLLQLESYNKDSGAYSYKVTTEWSAFFNSDEAKNYISIDEHEYVTWKKGVSDDDTTVAAFAKLALSYAQGNDITPTKTSANEGEFVVTSATGVFSNLPLGWYLVDSTAGALCGLTTTDPDASINAKNKVPTIEKQVQEDLSGNWGEKNTADIGQIVNFHSIIHVAAGAENYVMHDRMDAGLTFEQSTDEEGKTVRGVTQIVKITSAGETTLAEGTDYTVTVPEDTCVKDKPNCTFHVVFTDDFIASLNPNDRIRVEYNAMLNRHASHGTEPNINESWLEYGEKKFTTHDTTETYTFSIDIVKTTSNNAPLSGAKFRIYDAETGGNEVAVVNLLNSDDKTPMVDSNGNPMYRRARPDETGVEIEVNNDKGQITVVGFDNGTYYLEETAAPEGYNKLNARQMFIIADANLDAIYNNNIFSTGSGVHVINKTGAMLPETGGMGTTLFYILGGVLVLGAVVLLVTKKRMQSK